MGAVAGFFFPHAADAKMPTRCDCRQHPDRTFHLQISSAPCRILPPEVTTMIRLLEATARAERDHFWFRGFRRFVEPLVADAARRRALDILDCGCGTGHNLTWLRRYGRAYGIDLTWDGLQFARQRGERLTARATAAQLPFASERFDLVTSFDVLYALDDETERQAIAEMVARAQAWRAPGRQRRSARPSPRESLYSFGRSAPLQQGGPVAASRRRRDFLCDE